MPTIKTPIATRQAPAAIGPYSQAVSANGLLFCSGQIPLDPDTGETVGATAAEQTDQVMKNLSAVLTAAGASLADVVRTTIYLVDLGEFASVNAAYGRFFEGGVAPARATVEVAALPRGVAVEISAIAALESDAAK